MILFLWSFEALTALSFNRTKFNIFWRKAELPWYKIQPAAIISSAEQSMAMIAGLLKVLCFEVERLWISSTRKILSFSTWYLSILFSFQWIKLNCMKFEIAMTFDIDSFLGKLSLSRVFLRTIIARALRWPIYVLEARA